VRFHRTIAVASGNPILAALMETVTAALYDRRRHSVSGALDLKQSAEAHRIIYRAIRAGKPEQARNAMDQHLNQARIAQASESTAGAALQSEPPPPSRIRPSRSKPLAQPFSATDSPSE
jgi:GntR family transcriptional repressor for pyruvate dehydrogenase complex